MECYLADLFTERVSITLPERYLLRGRVAGNLVRQLSVPQADRDVALDANAKGYFSDVAEQPRIALLRRGLKPPPSYDQIVQIDEVMPISSIQEVLSRPSVRWQRPAPLEPAKISLEDFPERHKAIRATWKDALSLREEEYKGDRRVAMGFRPPQIGAIHAIKAHWVVSDAPSTLVMPTGTGKTETMLSVFVSTDVDKLLGHRSVRPVTHSDQREVHRHRSAEEVRFVERNRPLSYCCYPQEGAHFY
jgi:hypothetical protein